jgi:glycyl-tRNA synthetase beta chain
MKAVQDLLIELGTEELPPKALLKLSQAFQQGVEEGLSKAELQFHSIKAFATPRRLALVISQLQTKQPDRIVERKGPAVKAAFDADGQPTKALEGFMRSCGATVEQLETVETDKGAWLLFKQEQAGTETAKLLEEITQQSLNNLPIPKRMRWGDLPGEFVRPVHWLVVLFGDSVVPMEMLGVTSGRVSYGHRFHHPEAIHITEPATYAPQLETEGHVIADFATRQSIIEKQVKALADDLGGAAIINPDLLDEVTGLVEWPVALAGDFDERFLQLPSEALISSMEGHQKYFAVQGEQGGLLPHFITICNIASQDPQQVVAGNERVILPRLSDAAFFWDTDRKAPLADRQEKLKTIVFQNQLGTVFDKSARVANLAAFIADQIGGDSALAERAAQLAKCDLVTEMVGEFPELQGIMGRYYARLDGEHEEVAEALDEQYLPRFAGDALPKTATGQAVSLAEKIDTLVGLFGIGQPPSGVKDPFALRRAALGVLRVLIENELNLDLAALIEKSRSIYADIVTEADVTDAVTQYSLDRLRGYALDQGFKPDEFEAVQGVNTTNPLDFMQRLKAVASFRTLEAAEALAAANKRIGNILRKNDAEDVSVKVDAALLQEEPEQTLAAKVSEAETALTPLLAKADYAGVLAHLAGMREAVDTFFDEVMVMAEDEAIRNNRLALLKQTRALFLGVADISCLQA